MKKCLLALVFPVFLCSCAGRGPESEVMESAIFSSLEVNDGFWTPYLLIHKDVTLEHCVNWVENNFDSLMVSRAVEGMAYSLQFEDDLELKVRRSALVTRMNNANGSIQTSSEDICDVSTSVQQVFEDVENLRLTGDGKYADDLEQTLFNKVLSGISLKGDSFSGDILSSSMEGRRWQTWEETPSCAMDLFRTVPSIVSYAYGASSKALWLNMYLGGDASLELAGQEVEVHQKTTYPWDGYVSLQLGLKQPLKAEIRMRIPSWCKDFTLTVNGEAIVPPVENGYAVIGRKWEDGDSVELVLDMSVELVDECVLGKEEGKRAVRRGPIVYCMEEIDNPEVFDTLSISKDTGFRIKRLPKKEWWGHNIHRISADTPDGQNATLIPYFAWGNRDAGRMKVFTP